MSRQTFLPFSPPLIGEEELGEVAEALRSGWITTGPRTQRFGEAFAEFVDAEAALPVSSGTAALHTTLAALGVGPGDAVITTPMTFVSGVHVIEQVGARPVLVDVDPETLSIDPDRVVEAIGDAEDRVRAVIAVHLHGLPCELDRLLRLCETHDLGLVEDAAHAIPAKSGGRPIGSHHRETEQPVLTCFSFYATKNLTTGEGGMITGSRELIDEAGRWILHGIDQDAWNRYGEGGSWAYDVTRPGFKYNFPDVLAAIGLRQLDRLPSAHARRLEIASRYTAAFDEIPELQPPAAGGPCEHAWHIYALRLHLEKLSVTRDRFIEALGARNIGTSVHFIPVHLFSYYREKYGYRPEDLPVASREFRRLVSLPIYPQMTDEDVDDVIEAVRDVVRLHRA